MRSVSNPLDPQGGETAQVQTAMGPAVATFWQPDDQERASLLDGNPVVVMTYGMKQPPMVVGVHLLPQDPPWYARAAAWLRERLGKAKPVQVKGGK